MQKGAVVVGVDGSTASQLALDWAARDAALHNRPLRILHAFLWPATGAYVGSSPAGPPDGGLRNIAEDMLRDAADRARTIAPRIAVDTELAVCAPAARLIEESHSAATVVVGDRGLGGFTGLLVGSVGVQVAAHAVCPAVVVRTDEKATESGPAVGQVVAGVDGSAHSERVLGYAFEQASVRRTSLTVVRAWQDPAWSGPTDAILAFSDLDDLRGDEERLLAETLAGWQEKYPDVTVTRRLVLKAPAKELVLASRGAELLVVGSRGRGGFRGLILGSVSQAAIHHAGCPVAILRTVDPR